MWRRTAGLPQTSWSEDWEVGLAALREDFTVCFCVLSARMSIYSFKGAYMSACWSSTSNPEREESRLRV